MNQVMTGKLIAQKRKEQNLTQAQLAEKLNVSNKTVSKWETGKCMPDYSLVEPLCDELNITVSELIGGREMNEKNTNNDEQIFELLKRTQMLEQQKNIMYGLIMIVMGIAVMTLSFSLGGSDFKDFLSGVSLGMSLGLMLVGIFIVGRTFRKE